MQRRCSPMPSTREISAVATDALAPGDGTPGLVREIAIATDRALFVRVHGGPRIESGWHHHGTREVHGHVVRGRVRFEFGPGGGSTTEVEEGGFFHVPVGVVHRDVNPEDAPQELAIAFVGEGPLVVNLEGPDPG
jgi:quercetin dioxygenase-like cupin family protein